MRIPTIGLIVMCAALTACNNKSSDTTDTATQNTGQAVETPAPAVTPAVAIKAAPDGLPSRVAREVITAGGHKCDGVSEAKRDAKDGSIVASCSGGERYHVYSVDGQGAIATKL